MVGQLIFSRAHQHGCRALFLAAALIWLAAPALRAQIIYVSDSRSVNAHVQVDTNSLSDDGFFTVTYSGDYTGSASPSSPYADFNSSLGGTVNAFVASASYTNSYSANVSANQASSLNPQGISYSSSVSEGDNFGHQNASYVAANESSYLQVSFMVATATPYSLSCKRELGESFAYGSWTLDSANLGNLVSSPNRISDYNEPFNYSGIFSPGDVYTLTLQVDGGIAGGPGNPNNADIGGLQVSLEVPEPESSLLLGMGMLCFVAIRHRRKSIAN